MEVFKLCGANQRFPTSSSSAEAIDNMSSPVSSSPVAHSAAYSSHTDVEGHQPNAVDEEREEKLASWLFMLLGIGYLFPFSALTQPVDYWKWLFPDYNIEFAITAIYLYTNLASLTFAVMCFGNLQYAGRITGGLIGQLLMLVFVPTSYFFITSENANAVAVLSGTAVAAVATGFIDSAAIALVSHYPQRVQARFQLGIGLSTLIGSLYRDVTKLVFPSDQLLASSLIYFYTGALTIALCIGSFYKAMQLKITKKYLFGEGDSFAKHHSAVHTDKRHSESDLSVAEPAPTKLSVLKKVWHLEALILAANLITLSVWPPLVTEIKTYNFPSLQENEWWSLILLTLFAISDCVGRFFVKYRFGITPRNVWVFVLARVILVLAIIGIVEEWWLQSDIWSVLSVVLHGFGNGYLCAMLIIFVSESVQPNEQHLIGPFTSFFLIFGLVLGSTVGVILDNVLLG